MQESMEWQMQTRNHKRKLQNSISPHEVPNSIRNQVKKAKDSSNGKPSKPPMSLRINQDIQTHPADRIQSSTDNNPELTSNHVNEIASTSKQSKPVFVQSTYAVVHNYIISAQIKPTPFIKLMKSKANSGNSVQVNCINTEVKNKLIEMLKEKQLPYYTFAEPAQKTTSFVLYGYINAPKDEVLANIQTEKIEATSVTVLSEKIENAVYLVHFPNGKTNIGRLNQLNKSIGNVMVKWAKIDRSRKAPTQCHQCQRWGHTARNCGFPFRCVKCTNQHEPGKEHCGRKTRDGTAKCVNCDGDHPANSRECPACIAYILKTEKKRAPIQRQFVSTPAPWANFNQQQRSQHFQRNFPPLSSTQNQNVFSQNDSDGDEDYYKEVQVSDSRQQRPSVHNSRTNNFSNVQSAFMAIPDIQQTLALFSQMTGELQKCSDHGQRLNIMMRYCSPNPINNAP